MIIFFIFCKKYYTQIVNEIYKVIFWKNITKNIFGRIRNKLKLNIIKLNIKLYIIYLYIYIII